MFVQLESGREFKVQFVHSSRGIKKAKHDVPPGGLRQFIDNLARSFKRRVTFCELSEVVTEPKNGRLHVPIAQGFTKCSYEDQFDRTEGRAYAFSRALDTSHLTTPEKRELAELVGYDYDTLREFYR